MTSTAPDAQEKDRLRQLRGLLDQVTGGGRYVGYRRAEADARVLATALRRQLSGAELAGARFAAIPRGGLVVLGLLAYHLDLGSEQLGPADRDALLVLVDDCSLTGLRFRQALGACAPEQRVAFAHLYSHPALRAAILEQQGAASAGSVVACLAAGDLSDAPGVGERSPRDQEAWRQAWSRRLGRDRFWIGPTEAVAFAWSEPDQPLWNAGAGRLEQGWCWTPPQRCLRSRIRLLAPTSDDLDTGPWEPRWGLAPGVVYGDLDGVLWLCHGESGQAHALHGAGADMGRWLLGYGRREPVIRRLVREYGVGENQARQDLAALLADLGDRRLFQRLEAGS